MTPLLTFLAFICGTSLGFVIGAWWHAANEPERDLTEDVADGRGSIHGGRL